MEFWMWMVIGWIGGTIIGYALSWLIARQHDKKLCVGTLRVDRSDPDEAPYLFFGVGTGWDDQDSPEQNRSLQG